MKLRGLLVTAGGFSLVNERLRNALHSAAPDFAWTHFDAARDTFTGRPMSKLVCQIQAMMQFAPVMARDKIPPRDLMVRLPYFQKCLGRALAPASRGADFTLQTQSLFDARVKGKPNFIYTDHTYLANRRYSPPRATWTASSTWLQMEKSLYAKAKVCFTTSRFAADSIVEDYDVPRDRVAVIHSGCNTDFPVSVQERKYPPRRILFAGLEWERKGGPTLIEAFRLVRKNFADASLDIVGCSQNLSMDGVSFHGRVDRSGLSSFYDRADIFCLPSKADPSAAVLAEASAHGLPVVATRVGGAPERILDGITGVIVDPSDAKGLSMALCRLMENGELAREMGRRGREFALREFIWAAVAEKMLRRIREELS